MRRDYERSQALVLAEGDAQAQRRWSEVKQHVMDLDNQIELTEAGLAQLNGEIDASMGMTRAQVQQELDERFEEPVAAMIEGLEALVPYNERLKEVEGCSNRLLQTGRLALYNPGLEAWIFMLKRKLALVTPR
jgi:hypothetical protein